MRLLAIFLAATTLAGCATTPAAGQPESVPAAAPAKRPLDGNMVRSAIAPETDSDKELAKWARGQGFRLTKIKDKVMWCRAEAPIGSRISHDNCVSDDTLAQMRKVYEDNKADVLNSQHGCAAGASMGGAGGCASR